VAEHLADAGVGELLVAEAGEEGGLLGAELCAAGGHLGLLVPGEEAADGFEDGDFAEAVEELRVSFVGGGHGGIGTLGGGGVQRIGGESVARIGGSWTRDAKGGEEMRSRKLV
jgi:hypothetical protein